MREGMVAGLRGRSASTAMAAARGVAAVAAVVAELTE